MPLPIARRRRFVRRYDVGVTPLYAAACDPRVGWRLCVPDDYDPAAARRHPLAVFVHGTFREDYASLLGAWCNATGTIALCPLFPGGIGHARELDNYKFLAFEGLRFDLLLLAMIEEIATLWRLDTQRFRLFGFSGGAQFAHRFLLLHPERLSALVVAAAGSVTLPGDPRPYWVGTGDLEQVFGRAPDRAAIARVPVAIFVGADDLDTEEVTVLPAHADWMEGANDAGPTRVARAQRLAEALERLGRAPRLEFVPGRGHDHRALLPHALAFFDGVTETETENGI